VHFKALFYFYTIIMMDRPRMRVAIVTFDNSYYNIFKKFFLIATGIKPFQLNNYILKFTTYIYTL